MKPWNPYAMTFHGQPITGQTPPKLVVYGPPLTAQQGAMLQTAYNAFVGAARVSIVPNPTRQGRLLDGSPYTIECSHGVCTCTVWPVGAGGDAQKDIFSGLLFEQRDAVLVDKGDRGIPSANWERKEPPERNATGYFPERPPYATGLNTTNTSYLLPGKMRYMYRGYGQSVGRYGLLTANVMDIFFRPVGVTTNQKKFLMLRSTDKLSYCISAEVDMSKVFLPFGSAVPVEPIQIVKDATTERTISEQDTSHGVHGYMGKASVNRQGNRIVYMERHLGRKAAASDVVDNKVALSRRNIFKGCAVDVLYNPGRIQTTYNVADKYADEQPIKSFDDVERVFLTQRAADGFTAGAQVHATPAFESNAKTKVLASFVPAQEQINLSGTVLTSSVAVSGRYAPTWAPSARLEVSGGYWYVVGSSTASGTIGGTWRRNEKSHNVFPHYMGDRLVMLQHTEERKYEQRCTGTVDYADLDGTFAYGEYLYSDPVWPVDGDRPTGALETRRNTNQTTSGMFEVDSYYTLESGERLYLQKYRYAETGTLNTIASWNGRSGTVRETEVRNHTLSYTVEHERRILLAYDPELDLLCYSEGAYSLERDFELNTDFERYDGAVVKDVFTFTTPAMPVAPALKVVIKCRGVTREFEYPFHVDDPLDLLVLLPNTGISPYASGRDIKTDAGFPGVPIEVGPIDNGGKISLAGKHEDRDDVELLIFRGLPPAGAVSTPEVRYIKTPETGAALLTLRVKHGATTWVDESFVVDSAGLRNAVEAVDMSAINPHDDSLEPF